MKYELRQKITNINHVDGIPDIISDIMGKRGVKDINNFLHPSLNMLHNPFLFVNMKDAVETIKNAVNNKKPIIIHGDYDVDGTLATTIMYLGIRAFTPKVSYYIPDRHKEGYGLHEETIKMIAERVPGALIITVDCGITACAEVDFAKSLGLDVIVTDHHNQQGNRPDCIIIDAKAEGETYPFKELCGAGVALKVIQALSGEKAINKFIDLAAIATIADVVPLVEENRIIVSKGLDFINYMKRPGVDALIKQIPCDKITSSDIAFKYAPMINACGRLGSGIDVVKLMTRPTVEEAIPYAIKLNELNKQRKTIETDIFSQSVSMLGNFNKNSIVLWNEEWESGVVGIVASRLVEKYRRPAIMFSFDKGKNLWTGSGRSIPGVNLFSLLSQCKFLHSFGGHDAAAGVKVTPENIQKFSDEFDLLCSKIQPSIFEEKIICDLSLKMSDINRNLLDALDILQPCGEGNPEVKILLNNVSMKNVIIRAGKHFSASVFDDSGICDAVCFNSAIPDNLDNIDMSVSLGINKYKGRDKLQLTIMSLSHNGKSMRKPPVSPVTSYGARVIDQPIEVLGLNQRKLQQFQKAGIDTVQKLINYLPTKYNDFRYTKTCRDIIMPEIGAIEGVITRIKTTEKITYAMCRDDNGDTFMACWFHQDYVARMLSAGYRYIFCGRVSRSDRGMVQVFPMYFGNNISKYKTIIPEYKKIAGMSSEFLIQSIDKALQITPNTDFLELDIVKQFGIMSDYDATVKLHHPCNDFEIRDGQKRKVFNELFEFNFILKSRNKVNAESKYVLKRRDKFEKLKALLPYKLTNDQGNCIDEMYKYMNSGKILNALVQGDVGSGKTMVALFSMLLAINNGHQACIIAPTEVLARQHYDEISGYLEKLGFKTGYLVGGMKVSEKKALLKGINDGSINAIVGTHAVIQKDVKFNDLAVVVIDEQHKFGVAQREKLASIEGPHMISMSATPIPRTLSMATYGDNIQIYSIKQKPAGRKDVITLKMYDDDSVNNFMLQQIRQGHQCYVVCPMIDDSETGTMAGVRSVKQEAEAMINWFNNYPEVKISNITGRMKKELIAEEIERFVKNETNILISTTIIEVGVNVPNATVMVLKSSERFGLAGAHQLRGRVGRGSAQSYCLLQTDMDDPKADILCETTDGFEIARQDLLMRGSGDYIGTQQSGNNRNVMLMMSEPELYKQISELNNSIYKDPAKFAKYKFILEKIKDEES